VFEWNAQPSILTEVTNILDDSEANPGVKDLPRPKIKPQSPDTQPVAMAMSYMTTPKEEVKISQQVKTFYTKVFHPK